MQSGLLTGTDCFSKALQDFVLYLELKAKNLSTITCALPSDIFRTVP